MLASRRLVQDSETLPAWHWIPRAGRHCFVLENIGLCEASVFVSCRRLCWYIRLRATAVTYGRGLAEKGRKEQKRGTERKGSELVQSRARWPPQGTVQGQKQREAQVVLRQNAWHEAAQYQQQECPRPQFANQQEPARMGLLSLFVCKSACKGFMPYYLICSRLKLEEKAACALNNKIDC